MSDERFCIYLENPEDYRRFIRGALKYADCIEVSYTSDYLAYLDSEWSKLFSDSLIRYEYDDHGNLFLYLKIDHTTVDWLKSKKDILDFRQSDDGEFLWDLSLYKDGREIFASVTHERETYISRELWNELFKER